LNLRPLEPHSHIGTLGLTQSGLLQTFLYYFKASTKWGFKALKIIKTRMAKGFQGI